MSSDRHTQDDLPAADRPRALDAATAPAVPALPRHFGPRRTWTALLSTALILTAPLVWMGTMVDPFLRSTALGAWLMIALGVSLGLRAALADRRLWVRGLATGNVLLGLLGLYAFFELARTPPSSPPPVGTQAPAFAVVDERDRPVVLREVLAGGPALLVFYRGFW